MTPSELPPIDTPALLIDLEVVSRNLTWMQNKADMHGSALRPHIKTHKIPELALRQTRMGARGITVAKVSEAEVMAEAGIDDIFIANQIVTDEKLKRIVALSKKTQLSVGLDSVPAARKLSEICSAAGVATDYLIEIDSGLNRCGVLPGKDTLEKYIGSVDQMKVNEGNQGVPNLDDLFNDWKKDYSINNFAIIPHTVPNLDEDYVRESKKYMSEIYIQNDGADGNPWDSVSAHFERIVEILDEDSNLVHSNIQPIEVSATTHLPPVPNWIKFNAGLWSDDIISDSKFIEGILFLDSQGFLKLTKSNFDSQSIPPWIKNNAAWWSQDLIPDSDFLSGMEYLISEKILIP